MNLRRVPTAITAPAAVLLLLVTQGGADAQGRPPQRGASPSTPPAAADPAPSPEHAVLHRMLGTWSAKVEVDDRSGGKAGAARMSETNRVCCGGLFVLTELKGRSKKAAQGGRGILGYDPQGGRYILARVEARSTSITFGEGIYDSENDTLSFRYERPAGDADIEEVLEVFAWDGPDRRSRTVYLVEPDGTQPKLMSISYRRR